MKYRRRVFFTDKQKSEIWERGESMSSIGRGFDRSSSSIYPFLARSGGIRPPDRASLSACSTEKKYQQDCVPKCRCGPFPET